MGMDQIRSLQITTVHERRFVFGAQSGLAPIGIGCLFCKKTTNKQTKTTKHPINELKNEKIEK